MPAAATAAATAATQSAPAAARQWDADNVAGVQILDGVFRLNELDDEATAATASPQDSGRVDV